MELAHPCHPPPLVSVPRTMYLNPQLCPSSVIPPSSWYQVPVSPWEVFLLLVPPSLLFPRLSLPPPWYFMSVSVYNLVDLMFQGWFYTGVISQYHQLWVSKGSVGLWIPRIGRVIMIWDEVLFKIRVSFDGLVIRKKVFSESSHCIETRIDTFVEVPEV